MEQRELLMSTCRAVIFDMDGLMLDTERIERDACLLAAADMGCRVEEGLYLRTIGRTSADTRLLFIGHYGESFPYEAFRTRWRESRDRLIATAGIPVKPGLLELIDYIGRRPMRLAVATSTVRTEAMRLLTATGLLPRFDALVCGDEVTHGKPAPDLFLKAAQALGVRAADCIVLEDSDPGVLAANAAGMRVIVVPDLKPPSDEIAALSVAVCRSLHDVQRLLQHVARDG